MALVKDPAKGGKVKPRNVAGFHEPKQPKLPKDISKRSRPQTVSLTKPLPSDTLLALAKPLPSDTELPLHPTHQHNCPPPTKAELATIEKSMEMGADIPSFISMPDHEARPHIIDGNTQYALKTAKAMKPALPSLTGKPVGGRPRKHLSQCERP